jgi:hypothetical protein
VNLLVKYGLEQPDQLAIDDLDATAPVALSFD